MARPTRTRPATQTASVWTDDRHRAYFDHQLSESTPEFWRRFGSRPDFDGKQVLDLGCGHGAMSLDAVRHGANVLGVDLDEPRLGWAKDNVPALAPPGSCIEFTAQDVMRMGLDSRFDVILSKDTFEHLEHLDAMLAVLTTALKPGGELWVGTSPLYYSPFGDHGRTGLRIPWAHAVLPKRLVFSAATRRQGHDVKSLTDIGLNGMTPDDFLDAVRDAGLEIESIRYNAGDKPLLQVLDRVRRYGPLEKYATVSIYTVLRRPL